MFCFARNTTSIPSLAGLVSTAPETRLKTRRKTLASFASCIATYGSDDPLQYYSPALRKNRPFPFISKTPQFMYNGYMGKEVLCVQCANIFIVDDETIYQCPLCKSEIDNDKYNKLMSYAKDTFWFGYKYRTMFESELEAHGRINKFACFSELSPVTQWIILAIVSGVLGNATWDGIKFIVSKIIKANKQDNDKVFHEIIINEEHFTKVRTYIQDYNNGLKTVDVRIVEAINEEKRTYAISNDVSKKIDLDNFDSKVFIEGYKEAMDNLNQNKENEADIIKGLFSKLDDNQ